jgi:hypothetical protein
MKLFRKKVDRVCQFCSYAIGESGAYITCTRKKKLMKLDGKCMRFQYDPLKRVPSKAKALDFAKYEEFDYSL